MLIKRFLFDTIKPFIDSPEVIVVTGMRRAGKTSLMQYKRIKSKNKIFLDLENPLNQKYFEEDNYQQIAWHFQTLGLNLNKKAYIFLDEVQFQKKIPSVVKYFYDHYKIKFFLTGSASFYLKNIFAESLAGRKYVFELFPLSFKEFLHFKGIKFQVPAPGTKITPSIFNTFAPLYEEYLQFGGFPQVVLKDSPEEKNMSLEDIFSSYFQKEVVQLGDFRKLNILRDLILLLMGRVGQRLDIQKLSKEMGVSRPTIYEYISFLEGTYFIQLIRPFSGGKDAIIRKQPKIYLCDTGLANRFSHVDAGNLFENAVFNALKLKGKLNYYQKKTGVEIDFILNGQSAFEVKSTPTPRDINTLARITRELSLSRFYLVSREYSPLENTIYGFML
ncbi:MAG: ATP-binding protein [Caldiserica bacterium]|nr:ATP-binding protein [Caldisericota bacterium]